MPLVDFNPVALVKGYEFDVTKFNTETTSNLVYHYSFETYADINIVKLNIKHILAEFKEIIEDASMEYLFIQFEYSHSINSILDYDKDNTTNFGKSLWGLRHALCYQLLIYTYYKSITSEFPIEDINLFKLGIFGSVTPTSDIDIGFQYAKTKDRKVGIIAHVVEIFETAFTELTEKYSLGYDIEPYADMMYLDDKDGGLFYCDSTEFDENDLLKMMPAIGASIIRNIVQSQIDSNPNVQDVRKYKAQTKTQLGGTPESITALVNGFKFDVILKYYENLNIYNGQIVLFSKILTNDSWVFEARKQAINYMTVIYNTSRKTYYDKVKKAEKILAGINLDRNNEIPKEQRLELMVQIAEALVFRAESYVSPSTVMHVVRVMQAKEPEPDEGCDKLSIKKSKAQCALGKMGYAMSCLEQIGYLYRFYNTYCIGTHVDKAKCEKKIGKYLPRLKNGIEKLNKISGGRGKRHRRYSTKILKKVNTRRLKKRSNKNTKYIRSTRIRKRL